MRMRTGPRMVCGAGLRILSGVLRPRDALRQGSLSGIGHHRTHENPYPMSCAHRHLFDSRLSLHFSLLRSCTTTTTSHANTPKCPCLWHSMHLTRSISLLHSLYCIYITALAIEGFGVKPVIPEHRGRSAFGSTSSLTVRNTRDTVSGLCQNQGSDSSESLALNAPQAR